jgi:hypothetical protein
MYDELRKRGTRAFSGKVDAGFPQENATKYGLATDDRKDKAAAGRDRLTRCRDGCGNYWM